MAHRAFQLISCLWLIVIEEPAEACAQGGGAQVTVELNCYGCKVTIRTVM